MAGIIKLYTDDWINTGQTVQASGQGANDETDFANTTVQVLNDALNAVGFMENAVNFRTVMEEFGQGMEAALACIGVDLVVVGSGVTAAGQAFSALDTKLGDIFSQLESQMPYFTNTTSSITLTTPTSKELNALNSLLGRGSPTFSDPGVQFSWPSSQTVAETGGVLVVFLTIGGILALA